MHPLCQTSVNAIQALMVAPECCDDRGPTTCCQMEDHLCSHQECYTDPYPGDEQEDWETAFYNCPRCASGTNNACSTACGNCTSLQLVLDFVSPEYHFPNANRAADVRSRQCNVSNDVAVFVEFDRV